MAISDKNTIIRLTAAKKITSICLIMACFILAIASSNNLQVADAHKSSDKPDVEFIRQFGTSDVDSAEDVFADSSGVYVVGFTDNTLPGQTSEGSRDAFIRKYNSDGDEIWTRQFGTSDNDEARGVSVDSSGVYVAGVTTGTFQGESSAGDTDIFVRKYNSDGDEIWTRQFGSSEFDFINNGVSVDSSGVYVAGQTSGTLPGQTSEGDEDAFLAKLSIDDDDKKHDDDRKKDHDDDAKKKG
jgi:hypothetical protein